MTTALWITVGVLLVAIALLLRRLARAEGQIAYLQRKLAQAERDLAGVARQTPAPPPSTIEQLAGDDTEIDPLTVSRRLIEMGQREARGLLNVFERLTNRPSDDDRNDKQRGRR